MIKMKELIELLIFFNEIYEEIAWWAMGWMIWVFIWLRGFWFDLDVLDNNYILYIGLDECRIMIWSVLKVCGESGTFYGAF